MTHAELQIAFDQHREALNLLNNSATGQKIVDYVTVQEPTSRFDGFRKIPIHKSR